ncbi:MAG: hypothetical protein ACOYOL_10210 [Chthoniobacterales bacterium]|jgi:hypothetical protein
MKRYPGIDYTYRPPSYWEDETPVQAILKNIKGDFRREEIRKALAAGTLEAIPEEILQEALAENVRRFTGRIHPRFMGGEYLPDFGADEVEIARIALESTTFDVISVRARRTAKGTILYRVADEYEGEFRLWRKRSKQPLSLREIVVFLERTELDGMTGGLILGYNNMNAEYMGRGELRQFSRIGSEFYPQLDEHCEQVFDDWVEEGQQPEDNEEEA